MLYRIRGSERILKIGGKKERWLRMEIVSWARILNIICPNQQQLEGRM
jgi:hypothetical protein